METVFSEKDTNLTPREQEIFDMLLAGSTPKEIAFALGISYDTVKSHQKNIYRKKEVNNLRSFYIKFRPSVNNTSYNRNKRKKLILITSILGIILIASLLIFIYSTWSKSNSAYIANWYPTNDKYSKSEISKVNKEINGHTEECIMISGVMSGYKYAFSGASSVPFSSVYKSLWTMKSISFKVLGDGNKYFISFPTNETPDGDRWLYEFTTVKDEVSTITVKIPEDLIRKNWSHKEVAFFTKDVTSIQIQAISFGGYDLLVWDIKLKH